MAKKTTTSKTPPPIIPAPTPPAEKVYCLKSMSGSYGLAYARGEEVHTTGPSAIDGDLLSELIEQGYVGPKK